MSIWKNRRFPQKTFVYFVINLYDNFPTAKETRDKPINLYAKKLTKYIGDLSKIPQIDLSNILITDNGLTLEEAIGIKQELSIESILSLLSNESITLSEQEIDDLNLVEILKNSNLEHLETKNVKFPNKLFQWKPLNELFFLNDSKISIKPEHHIHEYFLDVVNEFGIEELSEESLQLKISPDYPSVNDDIQIFYKERAKYIAFKIDNLKWEDVESNIIEHLSSFKFYEVESLSKVFPKDEPIYEQSIDFYFDEKKKEVFYKGFWKTNLGIIEFLHSQFQSEKIEFAWFNNIINRWYDKKVIETLVDMFGFVPEVWIEEVDQEEVDQEEVKKELEKDEESNDPFWLSLTENDVKFIREIIGGDYELSEQMDSNLAAKIKTLICIKSEYSLSEIADEGYFLKAGDDEIIVRSAQRGLLFLDLYHWNRLGEENVKLAIHTNNQIVFFDGQEDLFEFAKPMNKYGIMKLPIAYSLEDFNSIGKIKKNGKWHFVLIVKVKAFSNSWTVRPSTNFLVF